jgi:hypothetical protein
MNKLPRINPDPLGKFSLPAARESADFRTGIKAKRVRAQCTHARKK